MLRFRLISHQFHLQSSHSLHQRSFLLRNLSASVKKEKYERKTPIEHILLRPGMYVGQIAPSLLNTWIYNENSMKMEKSNIYFSPALVKVLELNMFLSLLSSMMQLTSIDL
jgi:hypothetical protein